MADKRPVVRQVRSAGLVAYLLLPELAVLVLLGIATSWWLAGLIAAGTIAAVALIVAATRSTGLFGRAFGTAGYDPLDYTQWTRHLVVAPLIQSIPVTFAVVLAVSFSTAYDASVALTIVVTAGSAFVGFIVGGWLWLRLEDRRRNAKREVSAG